MRQELVTQEDVTGLTGRQCDGTVRAGLIGLTRRIPPFQPGIADRGQDTSRVEVRACAQSGRRTGLIYVAEQEQREQPAATGTNGHPSPPVRRILVTAVEVPSGAARAGQPPTPQP